MQKFLGRGYPLPYPTPLGAYGASIFAPTALKLNVTPPKKILVTALVEILVNCGHLRSLEVAQFDRFAYAYSSPIATGGILYRF